LFISEIVHTEDSFLLKLYYKFNFATEPYYASPTLGYNRVFNIKKKNTRKGGRIIFVDEKIDLNEYIKFLEEVPKQIIYY
jgi:pimeloyl-CoA synthetase